MNRRDLEKAAEYYPLESSQMVRDAIPRVRSWLKALEEPKTQFSRYQVAQDLINLAMLVMYDDGQRLGRMALARELLNKSKKPKKQTMLERYQAEQKQKGK